LRFRAQASVEELVLHALAEDEDQASADTQSASTVLLHPWKDGMSRATPWRSYRDRAARLKVAGPPRRTAYVMARADGTRAAGHFE
jgi:hypothetical protein